MLALTAIQTLSLLDCRAMADDGVSGIAELPALQTLVLDECELLTDEGGQEFPLGLLADRHQAMSNAITPGWGCSYLKLNALPPATCLNSVICRSSTCNRWCGVPWSGIASLGRATALQHLSLRACRMTGAGLAALTQAPGLRVLKLSSCMSLTRQGWQSLLH